MKGNKKEIEKKNSQTWVKFDVSRDTYIKIM